jgi:hypothetical protein
VPTIIKNLKKNSYAEKLSSKETLFLLKMSKSLHTSLAAMTHLSEGLLFNALITLKVENSLICLLGIRTRAVPKMELQFIVPLKTSIRNEA